MALAPTDRWRAYNTPAEHYSNPVKVPESTGPNAISRSGFFGYPAELANFASRLIMSIRGGHMRPVTLRRSGWSARSAPRSY